MECNVRTIVGEEGTTARKETKGFQLDFSGNFIELSSFNSSTCWIICEIIESYECSGVLIIKENF